MQLRIQRSTHHRGIPLALVALSGVGMLVPVGTSFGQQVVQSRVTVSDGGWSGLGARSTRISTRNIEKYGDVLNLSSEQREVLRLLFDAYNQAYQAVANERRDQTQALMRSFQDTQDHTLMTERMPELQRTFTQRTEALEKDLFGDLRAILTSEQEPLFDKVERLRRREVSSTQATLSGEGVDLTEVVGSLNLDTAAKQAIAEPLDQYEIAMDRALKERAEVYESAFGGMPQGGFMHLGPDAMERVAEVREKTRAAASRVRDVNRQFARLIESQLPPEHAAKFAEEVKRRSFSLVYREPHVVKSINAAKGFGDLSSDQRRTIEEIAASYARESAVLNDRWASALAEHEETGAGGSFMMGGMMLSMQFGDEPEALREARAARRQLDERTQERLHGVLTADQRERLPKPGADTISAFAPGIDAGGGAVILRGGGG